MKIEKESDLFDPVKEHFENLGFEVYGEIKNCDMVAVKENNIIVIELKKSFSLKLIYQAMDRKFITENVYVAIPRPKNFRSQDTKGMLRLLKEINIGLITVSDVGDNFITQIVSMPEPLGVNKKSTKRNKVLKEIQGRMLNLNKGGISKTKILTAYKEKCILVACIVELYGKITPSKLKKIPETSEHTPILTFNKLNWFDKPERGTYILNETGISALNSDEYIDAVKYYREIAKKIYSREENENV